MIQVSNLSKSFDDIQAIAGIDLTIDDGQVFGLVGTNGAGKSTFLRLAAGILKPDTGSIIIDGRPVYENPEVKKDLFYISDDTAFFPNTTPKEMAFFYGCIYPEYDMKRFDTLMGNFGLDKNRKIKTFSKGMKKQLSIILGIAANTRYLYCDETFDGLDPVMRQAVKSLFMGDMASRKFTPIIASHNLRELEDICDTVGLLHKGGILLSKNLDDAKADVHKLQCVFRDDVSRKRIEERLCILTTEERGKLVTMTIRGQEDEINDALRAESPVFMEILPLSLEEIFISETGVEGYDIKKIIC
ncbi:MULTISPECIES: ABC transporter ATP-binding protein [unclassified Butyrivibrio]|uniref:ABC transporter ATP-binding protein n=1 Tax=unclassified Butyrivibrio TaxID=2639466 RepID=UPI00040D7ADB|nr:MULTISPECIES: ABC transporter ATP-binding protein [unclassified Butyrivibrio]SDB02911.1 ABC-2 type transport system ATP-binding protein [Butyrivibrio sp. INlla16]